MGLRVGVRDRVRVLVPVAEGLTEGVMDADKENVGVVEAVTEMVGVSEMVALTLGV